MYLSDRDLQWALERKTLIVQPPEGESPAKVDPTSIDLRLDKADEAKIWDLAALERSHNKTGIKEGELRLGDFNYGEFSEEYLISPPAYNKVKRDDPVCRRGEEIIIRPGGFLLWQTKEKIGTPKHNPQYICFIDGKSTRARTGILVHLTAPTIHAGWVGNVVLEIANVGPFTFVLCENDVIAQLTVAMISSSPYRTHLEAGSATFGQDNVKGRQPGPEFS